MTTIQLRREHLEAMIAHAREAAPAECCGLVGGFSGTHANSLYRLRNVTAEPEVRYEAAPEDLFAAQRLMRERGEELLAIPSGTPQCAHNNYTHFVLEGSSDSGAMRIAVPDAFGRGDRGRSFSWRTPRTRWTADNIGTAQHLPAGARVMVSEGQVRLTSACFRSYVH